MKIVKFNDGSYAVRATGFWSGFFGVHTFFDARPAESHTWSEGFVKKYCLVPTLEQARTLRNLKDTTYRVIE